MATRSTLTLCIPVYRGGEYWQECWASVLEGHELSVLKGGAGFISSSVDTIIIEIALQRDQSWEKQSIFEIFALLDSWGFRLINIYDLHRAKNSSMVLVQIDCVFRHKSRLTA